MPPRPDNAPQTVRELLLRSLDAHTPVEKHLAQIVPIADPVFDRYVLRARKPTTSAASFSDLLRQSSCLMTPELFFVGPDVGQALLALPPEYTNVGTHFSIIPKHAGQTLHDHLSGSDATQRKLALMRQWAAHPALLDRAFAEAAFLGLQPEAHYVADMHPENIMVNKAGALSFIDMTSPEDTDLFPDRAQPPKDLQQKACRYVESLGDWLQSALRVDLSSLPPPDRKVPEHFERMLKQAEQRSLQQIEDGSVGHAYPQWQGFRHIRSVDPLRMEKVTPQYHPLRFTNVASVEAVALDAPPRALKERLDTLYAAAITR